MRKTTIKRAAGKNKKKVKMPEEPKEETPERVLEEKEEPKEEEMPELSSIEEYRDLVKERLAVAEKEKELLAEENVLVRGIVDSASNKMQFYKNITGLTVEKRPDGYVCVQCVANEPYKYVSYLLTEEDGNFSYTLQNVENVQLPEYLQGEIVFEKDQLQIFFWKMFEVLMSLE